MTIEDEKRLGIVLTGLAELFGKSLTRAMLNGYCRALEDLPIASVEHAIRRCERECKHFPSPFDIRSRLSSDGYQRNGSYPPDIARKRRAYGLPVTPEEHAAYDRGEHPEPPVTRARMVEILREVAARDAAGEFAPRGVKPGRVAWMGEMAHEIEQRDIDPREAAGAGSPRQLERIGGVLGRVFADIANRVAEREPGEEG